MAECGEMIGTGVTHYPCTLEAGHEGPHMSLDNARSVRERHRWEGEKSHKEAGLGEFQGRAETTAERYSENATDHPAESKVGQYEDPSGAIAREHEAGLHKGRRHLNCIQCAEERGVVSEDQIVGAEPQQVARVPSKQRPGDQKLPTVREGAEYIQDRAVQEIEASKALGVERYGTPLQAWNGRNTLRDAWEESRDQFLYMTSLMVGRETDREQIVDAVIEAWSSVDLLDFEHQTGRVAEVAVDTILDAMGPSTSAGTMLPIGDPEEFQAAVIKQVMANLPGGESVGFEELIRLSVTMTLGEIAQRG